MDERKLPACLYHLTHFRNRISIDQFGLQIKHATSMHAVWACAEDKFGWALAHLAEHHLWLPSDIIAIPIQAWRIPHFFTRHRSGIWYTARDIEAMFFARSPEGHLRWLSFGL